MAQLEHEDRLFRVLGIVGGLGFWEAWRLPLVCRELRFGFSGGGAPADMIKLGLEKQGVWARLREARAAERGGDGSTLLHRACDAEAEDAQRVCELVELGWPGGVDARDSDAWTPLMCASRRGHSRSAALLLAAGASADAAAGGGWTALMWACYCGRLHTARVLVAAGAAVRASNEDGNTPLSLACGADGAVGSAAIEALLLASGALDGDGVAPGAGGEGGAGGEATSKLEAFPGAACAARGRERERGEQTGGRARSDAEAVARGDRACSGALSAELNVQRYPAPGERSPAQAAAFEDKLFRVLGIVGGLGFWEAWRLPQVCRELRFGFSGGGAPADMIKLGLEKRGVWAELREARAARRDVHGFTRLHDACSVEVEDVQRVCELIELGWLGSVEARDRIGQTPLILASLRGRAGIIKALLAAGADVNVANNQGSTALIWACYYGQLEAAHALVASGADVNAVEQYGRTPLNLARGRNGAFTNPAIETLLLAAGATAV